MPRLSRSKQRQAIFNPGYFRWIALAIVSLCYFSYFYAFGVPIALQNQIQIDYNLSNVQYSLLFSVYAFPNFILPLFAGILSDMFGVNIITSVTFTVTTLGNIVFLVGCYREMFSVMLIGRGLFGIGAESFALAVAPMLYEYFKGKELAFSLAIFLSLSRLGSGINQMATYEFYIISNDILFAVFMSVCLLVFSLILFMLLILYRYIHKHYLLRYALTISSVRETDVWNAELNKYDSSGRSNRKQKHNNNKHITTAQNDGGDYEDIDANTNTKTQTQPKQKKTKKKKTNASNGDEYNTDSSSSHSDNDNHNNNNNNGSNDDNHGNGNHNLLITTRSETGQQSSSSTYDLRSQLIPKMGSESHGGAQAITANNNNSGAFNSFESNYESLVENMHRSDSELSSNLSTLSEFMQRMKLFRSAQQQRAAANIHNNHRNHRNDNGHEQAMAGGGGDDDGAEEYPFPSTIFGQMAKVVDPPTETETPSTLALFDKIGISRAQYNLNPDGSPALSSASRRRHRFRVGHLCEFDIRYWMLVLDCCLLYASAVPFLTIGSAFLQSTFGYSHEVGNALLMIPFMTAAVVTPAIGYLIDRCGKRCELLCIASALLMVSHYVLGWIYNGQRGTGSLVASSAALLAFGVAYAMFCATIWPSFAIIVNDRYIGTAFGIPSCLSNFVLAVSYLIVGALINRDINEHNSLEVRTHSPTDYRRVSFFLVGASTLALIVSVLTWILDAFIGNYQLSESIMVRRVQSVENFRKLKPMGNCLTQSPGQSAEIDARGHRGHYSKNGGQSHRRKQRANKRPYQRWNGKQNRDWSQQKKYSTTSASPAPASSARVSSASAHSANNKVSMASSASTAMTAVDNHHGYGSGKRYHPKKSNRSQSIEMDVEPDDTMTCVMIGNEKETQR